MVFSSTSNTYRKISVRRGTATSSSTRSGTTSRRWAEDVSGFLICTYWLVECLALAGEQERAEKWFSVATGHSNDLGLLSEEADPDTGELLGNYPQAFSHVGLINAAWRLDQTAPHLNPDEGVAHGNRTT